MKKLVALFLAMIMLCSLSSMSALADTTEFVELNLLVPADPPGDMTYLNKVQGVWNEYLKEKLNCAVYIEFLTWNDWETNYNLKLMAGEGLDLVTAGTWLDLWTNCSAGAYYDITELLPVYAPGIYARLDPSEWEKMKFDGQNLYIPQLWYSQWNDQGYAYRADWAEEVGITEPIDSFIELNDYLLKVQAAAGTGTIPEGINAFYTHNNRAENFYSYVTANTDKMFLDISTGFTFILAYGLNDGKVSSLVFDDEVMYGFADMSKGWYDAKVYNTDVLNSTADVQAMFLEELTACLGMHTGSYYQGFTYTFKKAMEDDPETEEVEGNANARVAYFCPSDQSGNLTTINPANDCMAISYASKNPERALMFLDLFYSDPVLYRLMMNGIEGETYNITEDGYFDGIEAEEWPEGEDRTFFTNMWGCRISEYGYPNVNWDENRDAVYAHKQEMAIVYPIPAFAFDSSMISAEYAAVCDVVSQYMPLITYGITDDAHKTVDEFRAALKLAGIDTLIATVQEQIDASLEK